MPNICTRKQFDFGNFTLVGLYATLYSATTPVCAQRCSSSGVSASTPFQSSTDCVYTRLVDYKVAVMAYQALNGLSPPYLDQLAGVSDLPGRHCLRSASSNQLQVPAYRLAAFLFRCCIHPLEQLSSR